MAGENNRIPTAQTEITSIFRNYVQTMRRNWRYVSVAGPLLFMACCIWFYSAGGDVPEGRATAIITTSEDMLELIRSESLLRQVTRRLSLRLRTPTLSRNGIMDSISMSPESPNSKYWVEVQGNAYRVFTCPGFMHYVCKPVASGSVEYGSITIKGVRLQLSRGFSDKPFPFSFEIVSEAQCVREMRDKLRIETNKTRNWAVPVSMKGEFEVVTLRGKDPPLVAQTLNVLLEEYIKRNQVYLHQRDERQMSLLEKQLEVATRRLVLSEQALRLLLETRQIDSMQVDALREILATNSRMYSAVLQPITRAKVFIVDPAVAPEPDRFHIVKSLAAFLVWGVFVSLIPPLAISIFLWDPDDLIEPTRPT